jgi:hypothetical protein
MPVADLVRTGVILRRVKIFKSFAFHLNGEVNIAYGGLEARVAKVVLDSGDGISTLNGLEGMGVAEGMRGHVNITERGAIQPC